MSNENYIIGLTLGLIIFGIALGISWILFFVKSKLNAKQQKQLPTLERIKELEQIIINAPEESDYINEARKELKELRDSLND